MNKYYVVIYTDLGESCDGFSKVLGTYKTMKEANQAMYADVLDLNKDIDCETMIGNKDRVFLGTNKNGCKWQILEVEIEND